MNYTDILQKMRYLATEDSELYGLIETRFYPHAIKLEDPEQVYPLINVHLMGSGHFPQKGLYPVKSFLFEMYYISDSSIDEANQMYSRFYDIINNNKYTLENGVMVVSEDTGIMDVSGIYGGQYLYILSNTFEVRKIN